MNRKNVIIISIVFLFVFIFVGYNSLHGKNKIELDANSDLISIWVEDSSGNYQSANSFPGAGYILNLTLSKCENGGTLSGDGTGVTLSSNSSDKCYLYFSQPWVNVNATKTLTCNSSAKTWDYKINGASFSVSTDADLTCTATKTMNSTSQNFASYLISQYNQGNIPSIRDRYGYRYVGNNPSNYIWFNNEMWRIIGVFGSARHGIENTNLVKIIRNTPIGAFGYDGESSYSNNYETSTLYSLLNDCYYNGLESCSQYCKFYNNDNSEEIQNNCDFSRIGLNERAFDYNYKDLIQEVTWYLGGPGATNYTSYYPDTIYNYETNSSAVHSGNPNSVISKLGLMYLSDYGFASIDGSGECAQGMYSMNVDGTNGYTAAECSNINWLLSYGYEWTISPNSNNATGSFAIYPNGRVGSIYSYSALSVRPVLYLKTNTYRLSGDGSITNPYVVGMI